MGTNSTVKSYTSRSRRVDPDLRVEHLRHRRAAAETAADTIAVAVEITADTDRTDDVVFVHDKKYVSTKTLE